jgi:hypothetical protein
MRLLLAILGVEIALPLWLLIEGVNVKQRQKPVSESVE